MDTSTLGGTSCLAVGPSLWERVATSTERWGQEMADHEVDPASLSYEDVEAVISNKVRKRIMKTKEWKRQVHKQPEKPKGFFRRLWHGFKRAVSWVWEKFWKLMDLLTKALSSAIRWLWNNGGEDALRVYAARELNAMLR